MANVYGTEGRLLEQLALNEELSVSQLARATGLSYPTTLYTVSSLPFVGFEKAGREKKVRIRDEDVDAVYPFLIALQTSRAKKAQLTMAFLSRKGLHDASLGGELALEKQLPVKDAEPNPEIEIRTGNQKAFRKFASRTLSKAMDSDFTLNSRIVEDRNTSSAKKIGLLQVSRPEKLLVDAVAEKHSRVFVENVAEAITNSRHSVDTDFLRSYAKSRGVLEEVLRVLEEAKGSGFP
jgi:DNA-binding transcriptional ArsR family regulator